MTPIERVAKALCEATEAQFAAKYPDVTFANWDDTGIIDKEIWRRQAMAAIEAMREPSEKMESRAYSAAVAVTDKTSCQFVGDGSSWPLFVRPKVLWQAAIDAALAEGE